MVATAVFRTRVVALGLSAVTALLGCTSPRCADAVTPLPRTARFAVVLSDYASSSIAMLDADGEVVASDWITSGSRAPRLVTPISGDAVLPQAALGDALLAWIDRSPADVITTVAMPTGEIIAQADLRGDREGDRTGFSPNPQDAVRLPDGRIVVSRLNPNPDPAAPPIARGNDLVVLGPGDAITPIDVGCDVIVGETTYFARPTELSIVHDATRDVLVVGLARLDGEFRGTGPGAIAVVDARTLTPIGCLPLDGLSNCTSVDAEPDVPERAMVLCTGAAFADASGRRASAGLVEVGLGAGGIEELARWTPGASGPVPTGWLVAVGSGRAVAVADPRGELTPYPDRLLDIDLGAGTAVELLEAEAFALGLGAFADGLLLVPDASRTAIWRLEVGSETRVRDTVAITGCSGLPPRQVGPL